VYVTGESKATSKELDAYTIAYDALTGARLWAARDDEGGNERGYRIAVGGQRVFVTEIRRSYGLVVAYDATTGQRLWRKEVVFGVSDQIASLDVIPGALFLAGTTYARNGTSDFLATRLRSRTGRSVWRATYGAWSSFDDPANDGALAPDGQTFYVVGTTLNFANLPVTLVAYNAATGRRRWYTYVAQAGPGFDYDPVIDVAPDGERVVIAARGDDGQGAISILAAAVLANGDVSWTSRDNGPGHSGYPVDVAATTDHEYVTGWGTTSGGTLGFLTSSYLSAVGGDPEWQVNTTGTFDSGSSALALAPDGGAVFVTGTQENDYLTEAYATG
jgi:hypothetical protein